MTPAERHSWLVEQGTERFIETFLSLFKHEAAGGRTAGVEAPSKAELRAFFRSTTPDYWAVLGVSDPTEAYSQLQQYDRVEA